MRLLKSYNCIGWTRSWSAGTGPIKDAYSIGDNPQFTLRVGKGTGSVWVLLTRHIMAIEDFRENHEYITLLVYQNNGKRVYYPCRYLNATFYCSVKLSNNCYKPKIIVDIYLL